MPFFFYTVMLANIFDKDLSTTEDTDNLGDAFLDRIFPASCVVIVTSLVGNSDVTSDVSTDTCPDYYGLLRIIRDYLGTKIIGVIYAS